jgi:tetratricopeptide (TPR) repeat protein
MTAMFSVRWVLLGLAALALTAVAWLVWLVDLPRRECQAGIDALGVRDFERAIRHFDTALHQQPNHATAYEGRAFAWFAQGDLARALADYTEAIRLQPTALRHAARGDVYLEQNDLDQALADYDEAVKLDAGCAEGYAGRGRVAHLRGQLDLAAADYSEALRLRPENDQWRLARGEVWWRKKEYALAADDLADAAHAMPEHPLPHQRLARLLATCPDERVRDGLKAVEYAGRACQLTRWQDAWCLDTLAAALAEVGKFEDAARAQQKALETSSSFASRDRDAARARLQLYLDRRPCREE